MNTQNHNLLQPASSMPFLCAPQKCNTRILRLMNDVPWGEVLPPVLVTEYAIFIGYLKGSTPQASDHEGTAVALIPREVSKRMKPGASVSVEHALRSSPRFVVFRDKRGEHTPGNQTSVDLVTGMDQFTPGSVDIKDKDACLELVISFLAGVVDVEINALQNPLVISDVAFKEMEFKDPPEWLKDQLNQAALIETKVDK